MTNITWGPEIAVNGVRPAWLAKGTMPMQYQTSASKNWYDMQWGWGFDVVGGNIRLPTDHFAYVAIDKGFEPWGGDDAAPDDWDGGEVLLRGGTRVRQGTESNRLSWQHPHDAAPSHMKKPAGDVIGYRKCTETPADTVSVPRLSLTDVSEAREAYFASVSLASDDSAVFYARRWGLLREETLAERFTRETGHEPSPAVLAALAFEREV